PVPTLPTGLLMFSAASVVRSSGAVITPTMLLQRTSANDDDAHSAANMKPTSATLLADFCFMTDSFRWLTLRRGTRIADDSTRSRGGGPWMSMWRKAAFGDGSVTARTRTSGHDWRDDSGVMTCRSFERRRSRSRSRSRRHRGGLPRERSSILGAI